MSIFKQKKPDTSIPQVKDDVKPIETAFKKAYERNLGYHIHDYIKGIIGDTPKTSHEQKLIDTYNQVFK